MTIARFLGADQNWADETTIYWFELEGETYGVADHNGQQTVVDADGAPLPQGPEPDRVRRACVVTEELRQQGAS